jgi:molybdopterin-binding protein
VSALTPMAAAASPRVRFTLTSGNIPPPTNSKGSHVKLSARNQLSGTVKQVTKGAAIANVVVDVGGQRIVSSITVEAAEELGLTDGTPVTVIVKASDVILATE